MKPNWKVVNRRRALLIPRRTSRADIGFLTAPLAPGAVEHRRETWEAVGRVSKALYEQCLPFDCGLEVRPNRRGVWFVLVDSGRNPRGFRAWLRVRCRELVEAEKCGELAEAPAWPVTELAETLEEEADEARREIAAIVKNLAVLRRRDGVKG